MTTVAIAMVRDEGDIIDATVTHTLQHVDAMWILDNGSVDGTRFVLDALAEEHGRLHVLDDPEPGYYQARKMTALAHRVADELDRPSDLMLVPVDADEVWTAGDGRIGDVLDDLAATTNLDGMWAEEFHHFSSDGDPAEGDIFERWGWRTTSSATPKVAVRWRPGLRLAQGYHSAAYFDWPAVMDPHRRLVVHHYPYRSAEQALRKVRQGAAAYRAAPDLPEAWGGHWREIAAMPDDEALAVFARYMLRSVDQLRAEPDHFVWDPAPLRRRS